MPPCLWTETRLRQAAEAAAEHGCASAVDVESLVAECRRYEPPFCWMPSAGEGVEG